MTQQVINDLLISTGIIVLLALSISLVLIADTLRKYYKRQSIKKDVEEYFKGKALKDICLLNEHKNG